MATTKSVASAELGVHRDKAMSASEVPSHGCTVILMSLYPFSLKVKLRISGVKLRQRISLIQCKNSGNLLVLGHPEELVFHLV